MIRKSLFALAAAMMTVGAFSSTLAVMTSQPSSSSSALIA
jgi:hypothetical protein